MPPLQLAIPPAERFRSGINTLRAVLIVDLLFDLLYLLALSDDSIGDVGHGIRFTITLALLGILRSRTHWRWVLAGWAAIDLAVLALEAQARGTISLWLIFTVVVTAYVYWACSVGERGMRDARSEPAQDRSFH